MAEESWFANANPLEMLGQLRARITRRRLHLFLSACLSQGVGLALDERWQDFIKASDRFERGELPRADYDKAWDEVGQWQAALVASQLALAPQAGGPLRDIFGGPFKPVAIEPAWLEWNDRAVPRVAERIYQEARFDDAPILADALEEAGCPHELLLAHARGPGPHFRGCWLLDLLLAR